MKANDRIRSEFNEGTVQSVAPDGSVTIQWKGYAWPVEVSADIAATFQVIVS